MNGISEIWLTSEDTGAYGMDRNSSLVELLDRIRSEVEDSVCLFCTFERIERNGKNRNDKPAFLETGVRTTFSHPKPQELL